MDAVIQWKYIETDGLPAEPSPFDEWCPKYLVATVETGIEVLEYTNGQWFDDFGNETSYTVYAWAEVNVPKYPTPGYRCPHCHVDVTRQVDNAVVVSAAPSRIAVCNSCREEFRVRPCCGRRGGAMNDITELNFEHAVVSFDHLMPRLPREYTAGELATAIRQHYSLDNPRTAWTVDFLEKHSEVKICRG